MNRTRTEPVEADGASGLREVIGTGTSHSVAAACAAALQARAGPVRLRVSVRPLPLEAGDAATDADRMLEVQAGSLTVELFAKRGSPLSGGRMREDAARELERIWRVQDALLEREEEIDALTFSLHGIEQVARTLSGAHAPGEAQNLLVDSVREVFFAWWAALYEGDPDETLEPVAVRSIRRIDDLPRLSAEASGQAADHASLVSHDSPLHEAVGHPVSACVAIPGPRRRLLLVGESMTGALRGLQELEILQTIAEIAGSALAGADLLQRLKREATVDPLTGCLNRRGLEERLQVEVQRARRYDRPLAVLMLDLDRFKQVNDRYGHDVGDRVLCAVGGALLDTLRETDLIGRYGGEEFAIVLPEVEVAPAVRAAERVRSALSGIADPAMDGGVTASLGLAVQPRDGTDAASLLRSADQALYAAKTAGGDRIVTASASP
jgi:diguanylate cyclase (GGDEF)-like protein